MEEVNLIQAVCDRINSDKCKLESKELGIIEVDSFNLSDFWSQFGAAVQSLSNQVTKLSFMCGKSPFPTQEELNGMLGDLMQHYSLMRDLYQVLPEEVGATVHNAVTSAVLDIMSSLLAVTNSLNDISDKGAKERLPMTSTFWDACNAVESLPRNNLTATLKALEAETALATDAQEELTAGPKPSDEPQRLCYGPDEELVIPDSIVDRIKNFSWATMTGKQRRSQKMTVFRPDGTPIQLRCVKIKRLLVSRGKL